MDGQRRGRDSRGRGLFFKRSKPDQQLRAGFPNSSATSTFVTRELNSVDVGRSAEGVRGRRGKNSAGFQRGRGRGARGGGGGASWSNAPLNFTELLKLADEKTQPDEIARRLGNNLQLTQLLQDHQLETDYLELVLVIIGSFCRMNGVTQFNERSAYTT